MIKQRIVAWFTPAPDSAVARNVRMGKSPWTDAVHLLWSVWIFLTPIFSGYTRSWALLTLASYPVFLVLYAKCVLAPRRASYRYALALVGLSLALMPWYPSGLSYFIYGCVMMCSARTSLARYLGMLVALNVACLGEAWLLHYPWQAVVWMPVMSFIIGIIIHAERVSESKDAELQLSHDEIRRLAGLAERERIGRDLHDLLGHTLSLITLKLELSRKLFDRDTNAARREVLEAEKVARHALAEVRSAVTGYRTTDLAAELASARLLLQSASVHLDYGQPPCMPGAIERALALVLREAATNISRHAMATQASVSFESNDDGLCLCIADNGHGGVTEEGNGLTGMRERVRALGGRLQIHSQRGQGTRLRVVVPLPATAEKPAAATATTAEVAPRSLVAQAGR